MTITSLRALALIAALLLAAGCGGAETTAPAATDTATEAPATAPAAATTPAAAPTATATPQAQAQLLVDLAGLGALADGWRYGLWLVDGDARLVATVTVDADGVAVTDDGAPLADGIALDAPPAGAVLVTVESDAAPAAPGPVLLAGELDDGGGAELTVGHSGALGTDFATAAGSYLLGTPTDPSAPETAGVWFLEQTPRGPSLTLPALPDGWTYAGWVEIAGQPLPTGRFTDPGGPDDAAPYSGPEPGPPFPGEDFLVNAPDGVAFPDHLEGSVVRVTAVPGAYPTDAPFPLVLLEAVVPDGAADHESFPLDAAVLPSAQAQSG